MTDASHDPAAPRLNDYALWLVPSRPDQSDRLANLIDRLASLETLSPAFQPHITLLHPIPLSTPLEEIHSTLREAIGAASAEHTLTDFTVELKPPQKGAKYYQSVLAPVKPIPALLALREESEKAFGLKGLPTYFPHLSLLYGELSPERRDEIAEIAKGEGELGQVEVSQIAIVRCVGTAENWEVVGAERL